MGRLMISSSQICISREQEEFLAAYRTDEAWKVFIDSYGKEKVNFLDGGYLNDINNTPYYTRLEYLEFTGKQYIDTGIKGSLDISYDILFSLNSSSENSVVFGCRRYNQDDSIYTFCLGPAVSVFVDFKSASSSRLFYRVTDYSDVVRVVSGRNGSYIYLNNDLVASLEKEVNGEFTTAHNLYIGYHDPLDLVSPGTKNFIGRFYGATIMYRGNVIMNLIPVLRDGVGCFYDTYSNCFFYNLGSEDFILGPIL